MAAGRPVATSLTALSQLVKLPNNCSDNEQIGGNVSDAKSVVQSAAKIFAVLRAFGV